MPGCTRGKKESRTITVAGSTSVEPFAEKLAEVFMAGYPGIVINVQGGGSSAGIQAALAGAADIGTSSRELKSTEKGLIAFMIARDGIAVIVHPRNPVESLTTDQVRAIFAGRMRNWGEIGGVNKPITAITREEGSGTRGAFEELIMKGELIADVCLVQDSNGSVREIVASDPNAIGFISLGLVDGRVRALAVDGVAASIENAQTGKYRFLRPFLFLTRGQPQGEIREFLDFVLGPQGQEILQKEGLVPPVGGRL